MCIVVTVRFYLESAFSWGLLFIRPMFALAESKIFVIYFKWKKYDLQILFYRITNYREASKTLKERTDFSNCTNFSKIDGTSNQEKESKA